MGNSDMVTVVLAVCIALLAAYLIYLQRRLVIYEKQQNKTASTLPLQAYERLLLLTDRIALPNLINRNAANAISAAELQLMYSRIIREEFDFNVTQQMFVSSESWKAVKNLKEKNLQIINQITIQMPLESSGLDLQRAIMQYLVLNPSAALHELVAEALSYEVKKLL